MVKDPLLVPRRSYVVYTIRVYNEGEVDVYAGEVTDYLPTYLDFVDCEINTKYEWKVEGDGKTVKTSYLSSKNGTDKIIKAFDKDADNGTGSNLAYQELQILCRINAEAPFLTKLINTAEVTQYQDKKGEVFDNDVDSSPKNVDNKNVDRTYEDDDDYEVVQVKEQAIDLA